MSAFRKARFLTRLCLMKPAKLMTILGLCLLGWILPSPTHAGIPVDPGFSETAFVSDTGKLSRITSLAWAPDGSERLFALRKGGEIRIVKDGVLLKKPFATISPTYAEEECGALGMCFDPNFVVNRYVYVFVTVSNSEQQI